MQEWTSLRLELLKYGFNRVEYWPFSCPPHGVFRAAVETPLTAYSCPKYRRQYEGRFVVEGLTRRQPPFVELIERTRHVMVHPWVLTRQFAAAGAK